MPTIASIKNDVSEIAKNYGISKMYLFGSYAKGTANAVTLSQTFIARCHLERNGHYKAVTLSETK